MNPEAFPKKTILPIENEKMPENNDLSDEDVIDGIDIDFEKLLNEKKELEKMPRLSEKEINTYLEKIENDGNMASFYKKVIEVIEKETNFFNDFKKADLFANLIDNPDCFGNKKKNQKTFWAIEQDKEGEYNPITDIISITSKFPANSEVIKELANGNIPFALMAALHETTHRINNPRNRLMREFYNMYMCLFYDFALNPAKQGGEINEASAFLNTYPPTIKKDSIKSTIDYMTDESKSYKDFNKEKLIYSFSTLNKLKALNFKIPEIGKIIQHRGRWNKKTASYPGLEKVIKNKMEELKIDEEDLDNLCLAKTIERKIDELKVSQIVQQKLKNYRSIK